MHMYMEKTQHTSNLIMRLTYEILTLIAHYLLQCTKRNLVREICLIRTKTEVIMCLIFITFVGIMQLD